jgi:hypothetical protein
MQPIERILFHATAATVLAWLPVHGVLAACNATVNGRPMSQQECNTAIQVYGSVIPGDYYADDQGNWVNANNPMHRGNTFLDARRASAGNYRESYGGSWGGGSHFSPRGVYDASGGCEGGSCVNIID